MDCPESDLNYQQPPVEQELLRAIMKPSKDLWWEVLIGWHKAQLRITRSDSREKGYFDKQQSFDDPDNVVDFNKRGKNTVVQN